MLYNLHKIKGKKIPQKCIKLVLYYIPFSQIGADDPHRIIGMHSVGISVTFPNVGSFNLYHACFKLRSHDSVSVSPSSRIADRVSSLRMVWFVHGSVVVFTTKKIIFWIKYNAATNVWFFSFYTFLYLWPV